MSQDFCNEVSAQHNVFNLSKKGAWTEYLFSQWVFWNRYKKYNEQVQYRNSTLVQLKKKDAMLYIEAE